MNSRLRNLLPLGAVLFALCGCAQSVEWMEEVQIEGGRVIRVERMQEWFRSSGVGEAERYSQRHCSLRIVGKEGRGLPMWSASWQQPIILGYDADEREYFLVAAVATCGLWKQFGSPKPPYAEYRIREGRWTRAQLPREHIGLTANLLISASRLHQPSDVSIDDKRKANEAFASAASAPNWYLRIREDAAIFGCR